MAWSIPVRWQFAFFGVLALAMLERSSLVGRAENPPARDNRACILQVQTVGDRFSPDVRCDGAPPSEFRWTWSDGRTTTASPIATVEFGSAAPRTHGLYATPASAVTSINLGFDGADGGETTPLDHRPAQPVSQVLFPAPLTGLRFWASSRNPISDTLDFTGFSSIEAIECFGCKSLQHVRVTDLPKLSRACFERCALRELDLSGNPNLADLRAAFNAYTSITVGRGTGPNVWHWCTRDNPQLTQSFQDLMTNFFLLRELYIWNDNQAGFFRCGSTSLTDVAAYRNHYTDGSVAQQDHLNYCFFQNNLLTNFNIDACPRLRQADFHDNRLSAETLDAILAQLDAGSPRLIAADLSLNHGTPSATSLTHYSNLIARGANVLIDLPEANDGRTEVPGGTNAITFVTTSREPKMEIRTENDTVGRLVWHWGDGTVQHGARRTSHDFGAAGVHTNYVEVIPSAAVNYFGAQKDLTGQGIARVYGVENFPKIEYLYLYLDDVMELSIAGCSRLTQINLAGNPVPVSVCDQWFIDLDRAAPDSVAGADFYYPGRQRSSASDAAWTRLVARGYSMHPL